jgi:hypothetical protein
VSIIDALGSCYKDAKIDACADRRSCALNLDGYDHYIILKGELICEDLEEICDCLVYINESNNDLFITIVEFKTNNVHVDKVVNQIKNGSARALTILKDCTKICTCEEMKCLDKKRFCHIAVARHWDSMSIRMMKSKKISINGREYSIHTKECGDFLKKILPKHAI